MLSSSACGRAPRCAAACAGLGGRRDAARAAVTRLTKRARRRAYDRPAERTQLLALYVDVRAASANGTRRSSRSSQSHASEAHGGAARRREGPRGLRSAQDTQGSHPSEVHLGAPLARGRALAPHVRRRPAHGAAAKQRHLIELLGHVSIHCAAPGPVLPPLSSEVAYLIAHVHRAPVHRGARAPGAIERRRAVAHVRPTCADLCTAVTVLWRTGAFSRS